MISSDYSLVTFGLLINLIPYIMKTKKYVLAIAIFGGMLFTAHATDLINLDGQTTTNVDKTKIKKLKAG